jgi:hypothetical protein
MDIPIPNLRSQAGTKRQPGSQYGVFGAGRSAVSGDNLGHLSSLAAIPEDDRAKSRDRRRDREDRGQRARFQLADAGWRQRRGPTAVSLSTDAPRPATRSHAASVASAAANAVAAAATAAADAACSATATFACGWSCDLGRCLWCFYIVILTRCWRDRGRALRGGALIGNGQSGGSGALGDGSLVAIGLGKGGSGLDAGRAALSNGLGHRGAGRGGARTGTHLRASRGEDDHVAVTIGVVSPRCLR